MELKLEDSSLNYTRTNFQKQQTTFTNFAQDKKEWAKKENLFTISTLLSTELYLVSWLKGEISLLKTELVAKVFMEENSLTKDLCLNTLQGVNCPWLMPDPTPMDLNSSSPSYLVLGWMVTMLFSVKWLKEKMFCRKWKKLDLNLDRHLKKFIYLIVEPSDLLIIFISINTCLFYSFKF